MAAAAGPDDGLRGELLNCKLAHADLKQSYKVSNVRKAIALLGCMGHASPPDCVLNRTLLSRAVCQPALPNTAQMRTLDAGAGPAAGQGKREAAGGGALAPHHTGVSPKAWLAMRRGCEEAKARSMLATNATPCSMLLKQCALSQTPR